MGPISESGAGPPNVTPESSPSDPCNPPVKLGPTSLPPAPT